MLTGKRKDDSDYQITNHWRCISKSAAPVAYAGIEKRRWGDNVFFIKEDIRYCDWWFV
jgi:hypothetical protein